MATHIKEEEEEEEEERREVRRPVVCKLGIHVCRLCVVHRSRLVPVASTIATIWALNFVGSLLRRKLKARNIFNTGAFLGLC